MNVPYTTRSGLKIGSAYTPMVRQDMPSKDAITLQKSLLNKPITTASHPVRSCDELGVCKGLTPPCADCKAKPRDAWEALCFWLARRFG